MAKQTFMTAVFGAFISALAGIVTGEDEGKALQIAEQWKDAALGRRSTAAALQEQADQCLQLAAGLRTKDYLSTAERHRNFSKAGDEESRAGDFQEAASANYEKESGNWQKAAQEYAAASCTNENEQALIMSAAADRKARMALQKAVENYLLAAEAYGADGACETEKARNASEKADALNAQSDAG